MQKNPLVIDGVRRYLSKIELTQYYTVSKEDSEDALSSEQRLERVPSSQGGAKEPPPTELLQQLDVAYQDLLRDSSSPAGDGGWAFVEAKKDITITRKILENSPIHSFKGEGTINRPMEEVRDFILDVPGRLRYDSMCKKIRIVEEYTDNCQLIHSVHSTKQCLLKTERDFLFATQYRVDVSERDKEALSLRSSKTLSSL